MAGLSEKQPIDLRKLIQLRLRGFSLRPHAGRKETDLINWLFLVALTWLLNGFLIGFDLICLNVILSFGILLIGKVSRTAVKCIASWYLDHWTTRRPSHASRQEATQ
ncbi:unnamed protein product [Phytophthora fragariaefolia]|uniref:Unnamed protein product n=1 Tax=Phytophthora fragariaefolia TaxID=1490495 RepID=A0A9W6TPL7_9STRA|nr:unnamed protein product [Phytophthora fragariaefolia]